MKKPAVLCTWNCYAVRTVKIFQWAGNPTFGNLIWEVVTILAFSRAILGYTSLYLCVVSDDSSYSQVSFLVTMAMWDLQVESFKMTCFLHPEKSDSLHTLQA